MSEVRQRSLAILAFGATMLTAGAATNAVSSPPPRRALFAEHYQTAQAAAVPGSADALNRFLGYLDDTDLLNLLNAVAEDFPSILAEGSPVLRHLRQRWAGGKIPWGQLRAELAGSDRTPRHRLLMLNMLAFTAKSELRKGGALASPLIRQETEQTALAFAALAGKRQEPSRLRAESAAGLAALATLQRELRMHDEATHRRAGDTFLAILGDDADDAVVRGRAAKALRALDDPRAVPALRRLIETGTHAPAFVTRCAITALAKMGERSALPGMLGQLAQTEDPETFATLVYAIGLYGDSALLEPLMAQAHRVNLPSVRHLLWYHRALVEAALVSPDAAQRAAGIDAVVTAGLEPLIPALRPLLQDADPDVRRKALAAWEQMNANREVAP